MKLVRAPVLPPPDEKRTEIIIVVQRQRGRLTEDRWAAARLTFGAVIDYASARR